MAASTASGRLEEDSSARLRVHTRVATLLLERQTESRAMKKVGISLCFVFTHNGGATLEMALIFSIVCQSPR